MAEPIGPEAYLAIAASVQNAFTNYRDKKRVEQNNKLAIISADSSKSSLTLAVDELLSCSGLKVDNDGYVQWAMETPAHPRNWSRGRKAYDLGLVLFLEFFMSTVGAGGTPASFYGLGDLGRTRKVGLVAFTTMYLLGQAFGALLLSPYSDRFGRRTLYIASALLYSVFCLPVAATSNIAGVFIGRLITGVISAIPVITVHRSIEDIFGTEGRMWAFFSWALVTNLGLAVGPVYASYIAVSLNWRWTFYLATIIVAVTGMLMYFIRESHTSQLLERKVAAIQSHRADLILRTAPTAPRPSILQPVVLFCTRPTIFFSSLTNAFTTSLLYLFAVAFPLIYAHYAWNRQKTTLIFLFIALGLFLSILTRFHDRRTIHKHRLANGRLAPEKSLFGLAIGGPALALGLWWFAWTIPGPHVRNIAWPASAVSLILVGYGINEYSTVLPRYVLDTHKSDTDAASAFVATLSASALLGAVFPLFTQQLFENLGANPAASVLAAVATASCFLLIILARCGTKLRGSGPSGGADDKEGGPEIEKKKVKPKKTVRWDDETDSSLEGGEMKSESATGSDISMTETQVERRDFAGSEVSETEKTKDGNGESRVETTESGSGSGGSGGGEVVRVGSSAGDGGADSKRTEKERTRIDDGDDGAAGFIGADVERLAVFTFF